MKKIYLFFVLLLSVNYISFAQSNFKNGFIVNLKGDTVKGYIDYREWDRNPKSIEFKSDLKAIGQIFSPADIKLFKVTGYEYYESHLVKISMDKTNINDLSYGADTSSETAHVLLRVIQKGKKVTLFSFTDDVKTRFYIQDVTMVRPEELIYKIYFNSDRESKIAVVRNTYYAQLLAVLKNYQMDSPDMIKQISELHYQEKDITKIVSEIDGGNVDELAASKTRSGLRYFIGAGLNISSLTYSGDNYLATNPVNNTSYSPKIGLGCDVFLNPNVGQLFIRAEAGFTGSSFTNSGSDKSIHFPYTASQNVKQYTGSVTLSIFYNFYNTDPLKVFLGAGVAANFSSYPTNQYTEQTFIGTQVSAVTNESNYPKLESFWASVPIKLGVILNKKVELYGSYMIPAAVTNYNAFSGRISSYQFGINYLFGGK